MVLIVKATGQIFTNDFLTETIAIALGVGYNIKSAYKGTIHTLCDDQKSAHLSFLIVEHRGG